MEGEERLEKDGLLENSTLQQFHKRNPFWNRHGWSQKLRTFSHFYVSPSLFITL